MNALPPAALHVSEEELEFCRDVLSIISSEGLDAVFSGDSDDVCVNASCIAAAVRDAEVFAQLRPKLLKPFQRADQMFDFVSQLKQLLESNGSRLQAMQAVTCCGLEGVEQRTLAAAALLLFDEAASSATAPIPAPVSTPDYVSLQAPSEETLQQLRAAVLALEDDRLEDLEILAEQMMVL